MIRKRQAQVQAFLGTNRIDGWLIFDFRGSNPFMRKVFDPGIKGLLSRRWFLWVPCKGEPKVLVHDIEFGSFPKTEFELRKYNGRETLVSEVQKLVGKAKTIAMEYSPSGNNPYVSKVDAGTMDMMRDLGLRVVSSGDLLQLFLAWTPKQLANHKKASKVLAATKDFALTMLRERIANKKAITEYELQQAMNRFIQDHGMDPDHPPIIGFDVKSNDPHYAPSERNQRRLKPGPILMDLWCKVPGDNPFADITWMAHWGSPSEKFMKVFNAVLASRDAGVELLNARLSSGQTVKGYEVDRAVRKVLIDAGYEQWLKHRTGHSLGTSAVHGEAAHFDGFETLDERAVLPGLGFTVEPGVYTLEFGVRSEINVYSQANKVDITTAIQRKIDVL
jgi:Xaa-Pro aminopeptidase